MWWECAVGDVLQLHQRSARLSSFARAEVVDGLVALDVCADDVEIRLTLTPRQARFWALWLRQMAETVEGEERDG